MPLKGRDFAGLGFGICGTKRDGIFVKDLLHHGPASESGRIKAGKNSTYPLDNIVIFSNFIETSTRMRMLTS